MKKSSFYQLFRSWTLLATNMAMEAHEPDGERDKIYPPGRSGRTGGSPGRDGRRGSFTFFPKDTGIGISKNKIDLLFDKFTQVDTSTTRRYGGTGLGLAISKQLTEMMGGQIGVDSREGEGSNFWFSIRLAKQSGGVSSLGRQPGDLAGRRVLVVDDNETNREILYTLLTSWEMRPKSLGERLMNDGDPIREVTRGFLSDLPRQIEAVEAFWKEGDLMGIQRQAHTIKGASANVSGEALRAAAKDLEDAAKAGDPGYKAGYPG